MNDAPPCETPPLTVLVVDDEELLVRSCQRILESEGYRVMGAARVAEALDVARRRAPDIVLADLALPDGSGLALLRDLKRLDPDAILIMITAFATVESSIEAIRLGAYDYLPKPFTAMQLQILVGRAAAQVRLARDNARLRGQLEERAALEGVVGVSSVMDTLARLVGRVAGTDANVLISGESGTGKELIARALHQRSPRQRGPFVPVNCAAFPPNLLESELFGHEKGAFTGADTARRGLLEHAERGTFFLDEVCEMGQDLQAKLLRVLQERRIRRVGGTAEIPIDVRVVAATNQDPQAAVAEGILREDLYYRLNVVPIQLPPLRRRREDIPHLARHFLREYAARYGRDAEQPLRLSGDAMDALISYDWPGNVRELRNLMERIASISLAGVEVTAAGLPMHIRAPREHAGALTRLTTDRPFHDAKAEAIRVFERHYLESILERHHGNVSKAARDAGMDRKTIHRLLNKHSLVRRQPLSEAD